MRAFSSAILKLIPVFAKSSRKLLVLDHSNRLFHKQLEISPYLLDRTKPAEEILESLAPEDAKRLEYIKAEHSMFLSSGKSVPVELTNSDYLELLCCPSVSARNRYYLFRFKVSKRREMKLAKKSERVEHVPEELVQKNQILRMIRSNPIRMHEDDWVLAELRTAENSAQTLVFDCSHENEMRLIDQKNLARQLANAFAHNRMLRPFPFHFMFTSLVPGTNQYQFFQEAFGIVNAQMVRYPSLEECPFSVRPEHFTEVIKDRRLVYLSPDAPRAFKEGEYDHDAVYVVGGIVDKAVRRPVTHARARRAGWECMRLPLERYINWRSGNKTLSLVAIHGILATAKQTNGDWKTALEKNIPSRFLYDHDPAQKDINKLFRSI